MKRMLGFMLGAVVGAAIGAGVALLFAPESGEELRMQLFVGYFGKKKL